MIESKITVTETSVQAFDVTEALSNVMQDFADLVLERALDHMRKNESIVTKNLAHSGRTEFDQDLMEATVIFGAPYAVFVEFGTRPHIAPLGKSLKYKTITRGRRKGAIDIIETPDATTNPLDYWAWRKMHRGGMHCWLNKKYYGVHTRLGWGVWKKIIDHGTDAHPYLRPAVDEAKVLLPSIAAKYGLEIR